MARMTKIEPTEALEREMATIILLLGSILPYEEMNISILNTLQFQKR